MKKESLSMLLVTKIPKDEPSQKEVLEAVEGAFQKSNFQEYLTLLRASYMGPRDIEARPTFYSALSKMLVDHLGKKPEFAAGISGLYVGFIAEDLGKTVVKELQNQGRSLGVALRMASNPPAIRFTLSSGDLNLPSLTMAPAEVSKNPEAWITFLYKTVELWKGCQLQQIRENLLAPALPTSDSLRRRSHALLVVGAHLENAGALDWANGCYLASATVDPSYDLPWAFLAPIVKDPAEALLYANRALVANPKSLPGLVNRGNILARLGKSEDALRDLAEACRYDSLNTRLLLQCANAALEAGLLELSVRLFLYIQNEFSAVPEPWFGLARLFWRAGIPEMAKSCQEKFRHLRHGNLPKGLHLVGRLRVEAQKAGIRVQVGQVSGVTPLELGEISSGEHRISWENGPVRKVMIDQGESLRVTWKDGQENVEVLQYTPEPTFWKHVQKDGSVVFLGSKEILERFLVDDLETLTSKENLVEVLSSVPAPCSPFSGECRLSVEGVFRILLEEILADGILDAAEGELLRAVRDRLMIDPARYEVILGDAQRRAVKLAKGKIGSLDPKALYRRLFTKAIEDRVLEDGERLLLETIAEALLLAGEEVMAIEAEILKSRTNR